MVLSYLECRKVFLVRQYASPRVVTKRHSLIQSNAENQKVKRWLLMSMSPEIMKRYLRLPTAQEIWSALSKAFYDGSDELQVFTLNQKAFTVKGLNQISHL